MRPRTSVEWQLEPNAEREILLPWLDVEPDPLVRESVLRYLARLLEIRTGLISKPVVSSPSIMYPAQTSA